MPNKRMISVIKQFMGSPHVTPVGRAALGIYAAIVAWTNGKEAVVAVPASVCQDVVSAILMAKCQPIFCDVNPISGLSDECEWLKARAAGATVAIVVHLYGNPANTARIRSIFPQPDCLLIDDAAQALGAYTSTGMAGSEGDIGVISFGATKHIEIGGAALLSQNETLIHDCQKILVAVHSEADETRHHAQLRFRQSYERARAVLLKTGDHSGFAGLLNGYEETLKVQWQDRWADPIAQELENYPKALALRQRKAELWLEGIAGTQLQPVGMNTQTGCAPWRFACRWTDCSSFKRLHQLGESLRGAGLHVSHWYLPANWWQNKITPAAVGSETLAQQALQFWLDPNTDLETIQRWIPIMRRHLAKMTDTR